MKKVSRAVVATAMLVALSPVSTRVEAASTVTVSGKAPKGYSVLMVGKSGDSVAVKGSGKFSMKVAAILAKSATLHLVSNSGKYAGPVTLKYDKKKKTGNTQLSGKTGSIGTIAMKTGYAVAAAKSTAAISTKAKITVSTAGAPAGAGKLGLASSTAGSGVRIFGAWKLGNGNAPKGEDTDKDGLPNTLDLDDDNDSKIDLVDDSNPSQALTTGSLLFLDISKTINFHAGMGEAAMQSAIDAVLKSNNNFWIGIGMDTAGSGKSPDGVHLSCAAEVKWCSTGSPAVLFGSSVGGPGGQGGQTGDKWEDKKADGFSFAIPKGNGPNCDATLNSSNPACTGATTMYNRQFIPQMGTADVTPGSLFSMNMTTGGKVVGSVAGTLAPYFASVPALKEVGVGGQTKSIDYSKKEVTGAGGALGTQGNPIVVPAGNKTISLTFWRPQRSGVTDAGEGRFVDMGALRYGFYVGVNRKCDAGAMTPQSSTLVSSPGTEEFAHTPLVDSAKDAAPNPANTMTFTVDLSKCEGGSAPVIGGSAQMVTLIASSPANGGLKAYQDFYVKVG